MNLNGKEAYLEDSQKFDGDINVGISELYCDQNQIEIVEARKNSCHQV